MRTRFRTMGWAPRTKNWAPGGQQRRLTLFTFGVCAAIFLLDILILATVWMLTRYPAVSVEAVLLKASAMSSVVRKIDSQDALLREAYSRLEHSAAEDPEDSDLDLLLSRMASESADTEQKLGGDKGEQPARNAPQVATAERAVHR